MLTGYSFQQCSDDDKAWKSFMIMHLHYSKILREEIMACHCNSGRITIQCTFFSVRKKKYKIYLLRALFRRPFTFAKIRLKNSSGIADKKS